MFYKKTKKKRKASNRLSDMGLLMLLFKQTLPQSYEQMMDIRRRPEACDLYGNNLYYQLL